MNSIPSYSTSSSTPTASASSPSTSGSSMPPLGGPVNSGLLFHEFHNYLASRPLTPQQLEKPLTLALGESDLVFTHCLDGHVFGDLESLTEYQKVMGTIKAKWPSLTNTIEAQGANGNRVAVFATRNSEALAKIGANGHWGGISATEPCLKDFSTSIVVDVNKGRTSVAALGHEWTHEVQSFRQALLSGRSPTERPPSLTGFLNNADASEVAACWFKGYEKYAKGTANAVAHTIYGKPAKYYAEFCQLLTQGNRPAAEKAWTTFTSEIGTHLAEGRLKHGFEAMKEHAHELSQMIDTKLKIKLFSAPEPGFASQLWSCTKRYGFRGLAALAYGLDVYQEYTALPETAPSRNMHALINGTTRNILGMGMFYSTEVMMFYDTTHLGSSAEAMQHIETTVGSERLQEILKKGNALYAKQQLDLPSDPYCPVLPVILDKTLSGEERSIYLSYMNAQCRSIQEAIQGPLTSLYDSVKHSVSQLFLCHSAPPEKFQSVVHTIASEVRTSFLTRDVSDPNSLVEVEKTVRERVNEIVGQLPRIRPAIPPEQVAAALTGSSSAAPLTEDRVVHTMPASEEPTTDHPLQTTLRELGGEVGWFSAQLQAATSRGELVDESTLGKINALTDGCERAGERLQNRSDKDKEVYTAVMDCVRTVATQLDQMFRYRREQHAQNAARKEERRNFKRHRDQLRSAVAPQISYVEIEKFAFDMYSPKGQLCQTIFELRRDLKTQLEYLAELKERRSARETALEASRELSHDIDRNERALLDIYERELKQQQKIGRNLNLLSIIIGAGAGIMAACACPALYVATATAAHAGAQMAQTLQGESVDRRAATLRRGQARSLDTREIVAKNAQTQKYELSTIESQIQQWHHILLTQASWCDSKALRELLEESIKEDQVTIDGLQERINYLTDGLEVDHPKEHRCSWNTAVELAQDEYNRRKKSSDAKPDSTSRRRKKHEAKQTLDHAKAQQQAFQTDLKTNTDLLKDTEKKKKENERLLEQEKFLAPMKEQVERTIMEEQQKYDFDRHLKDKKKLGIKAGDLTELGLAQREMRISFARVNEARMLERQMAAGLFQASKGLAHELGYFLGSRKYQFGAELGEQLYRIVDLYKHFTENAIPRFNEFVELLKLQNASFLEQVGKLNAHEIATGFIIPGVQLVAACLAVVRLGQSLTNKDRLPPEQQFVFDLVQKAFEEHQKYMGERFDELKGLLENRHMVLTEDLKQLHSNVGFIGQELRKTIKNSQREILGQLSSTDFDNYKSGVENIADEWLERDRLFWKRYPSISKKEDKKAEALAYLSMLEASLPRCISENLNGLTYEARKWKPRFTPACMATAPEYVGGALAELIRLNEPVPSRRLFNEPVPNRRLLAVMHQCVDGLEDLSIYPEVAQRLENLKKELDEHNQAFRKLARKGLQALKNAKQADNRYIRMLAQAMNQQRQISHQWQQDVVGTQITSLLPRYDSKWLSTERVGEHKFGVCRMVHENPIGSDYTPNIFLLNAKIDRDFIHDESKDMGKTAAAIAGVVGLPGGGPLGAGVFAGAGGAIGYGGTTLFGYGLKSLSSVIEWAFDEGAYRVQREIKNLFRGSISDVVKAVRDWKTSGKNYDFSAQVAFCNETERYRVTDFRLFRKNLSGNGTDYSAGESLPMPPQSKTLMAFTIDTRYPTPAVPVVRTVTPWWSGRKVDLLPYETSTIRTGIFPVASRSLIQSEEIEQIAPPPKARDYAVASRRMLTSYFECLHSFSSSAQMQRNNPFNAIIRDADFIPCANEEFLPLLMPKTLLQSMERELFAGNPQLMVTDAGHFLPYFEFRKESSGSRYELVLQYKFFRNKEDKPEDYGSFRLATFDRNVVESFAKMSFPKQGSEWGYEVGKPNLQEFLIQAFYGQMFGLGLPGKGSIRLSNVELCAPQDVPFAGMYAQFALVPDRAVHYTLDFDGTNHADLYGAKPVLQQGRDSSRIWFELQQDTPKSKLIEDTAKDYADKFYLALGLYSLCNSRTPEENVELLQWGPELPFPTQQDQFLARAQALDVPEGTVSECLGTLHPGFWNIGNSCWMNVCLQWLHTFPDLRESVLQQLRNDGKGEVVMNLERVLTSYQSSTPLSQQMQLDRLRNSLFSSNIYEGSAEGMHDPADLFTGRIGSSPLSYITLTANESRSWWLRWLPEPLQDEILRVINNAPLRAAREAPEYIVVERKHSVLSKPARVSENETIELRGKRYAIVGLIEHKEMSWGKQKIGHYIAYIRNKIAWTRCDDKVLSQECAPPLATAALYLLKRLPDSSALEAGGKWPAG